MNVGHFFFAKVSPLAHFEGAKFDVHNANALELNDFIAKVFTHATNLPIKALGQNNFKGSRALHDHFARFGFRAENGNAAGHFLRKISADGLVDGDDIFFFMCVTDPQDFINNIAVTGEEDKPFRLVVEAADRVDSCSVTNSVGDIIRIIAVGGAGDANGFVVGDIDAIRFIIRAVFYFRPADFDCVTGHYAGAEAGYVAVNGDLALLDMRIGFTA